jgi:membrane protein
VRLTLTPIRNLLRPNRRTSRPAQVPPEPTPPPKPVYTLPARPPEPITVKERGKEATGPVADATKVVDKVTRKKYVALVLEVLDIAGKSGAGLFAAALAYGTMFALIPVVLLMAGVLGWFVSDPVQRQELLNQLIGLFPPLADFFSASLNGLVDARGALSVIGLVGLVWGASAFYGSLDEVMRRIFLGGGVRGELDRRLRGIITVVGLLALMIGTVLLSGVLAFVNDVVGNLAIWGILFPLIAMAVFVVAVLLIYLLVPTAPPSTRAAFPPALVAGMAIALLTNLFGVLAPLLVGGLTGLGVIATAFALLIWLNFSYQILLYGASWARLRRDREREKKSVVEI